MTTPLCETCETAAKGRDFEWFKWYPRDALLSVRGMSFREKGIYFELLDLAWIEGGLPASTDAIRDLLTTERRTNSAIRRPLVHFYGCACGRRMFHRRMEEQRAKLVEAREKRRSAAKTGHQKSGANAEHLQRKTETRVDRVEESRGDEESSAFAEGVSGVASGSSPDPLPADLTASESDPTPESGLLFDVGDGAPDASDEKPRPPPKPGSWDALWQTYLQAFQKLYGSKPTHQGHYAVNGNRLLKEHGFEVCAARLYTYLAGDDWSTRGQSKDFGTFIRRFDSYAIPTSSGDPKIDAELHRTAMRRELEKMAEDRIIAEHDAAVLAKRNGKSPPVEGAPPKRINRPRPESDYR